MLLCLTGCPPQMDQDDLEENMEAARNFMDDEANRTRGGFQPGGLDPPRQACAASEPASYLFLP